MENSDWVKSDWLFPFIGSGSGGYGADGNDGTTPTKGGEANGGTTSGGHGGLGDIGPGFAIIAGIYLGFNWSGHSTIEHLLWLN